MATYEPPTENLAIFDPVVFLTGDEPLTYNVAVKKFLKYPNAQGLENLQAINVNGIATFNTNAIMKKPLTMSGAINTDRIINNVYYQLQDANSLATTTGQIYAGSGVFNYDNDANGGTHNFAVNTAGGVQTIPLSFNSVDLNIGTSNGATITTANGVSAQPTLDLVDSVSGNSLHFITNGGAGSYNPASDSGNQVLVASGTQNTEVLELTTWSATNSSLKVKPTSVVMGAGGATNTPTTSVECNGTSVVIAPSITYPDGRVQNSAFTGAGALTGSYTLANITIDSNGKITAISNGSAGTQFVPKFHNFSNTQNGTSGYSQGPYINWGSGWGANDYVIIRVRAQVNWGDSGSGWTQYATTAGELILRPHFAPAGVIGSLGGGSIFYTTNSGSVMGNTQKLAYYTGAINNGSQGYFYLYGNGGSGGGASGSVQLMCGAPGSANGWEYTCSYEYIIHSGSGASISFTNGPGGGSGPTTNNSLP